MSYCDPDDYDGLICYVSRNFASKVAISRQAVSDCLEVLGKQDLVVGAPLYYKSQHGSNVREILINYKRH